MNLTFDIRTVLMFGAMNTAICCATLFMSRSLHQRSAPALAWGATMHLFATIALALFALRGHVSDWYSITLANSALMLAWCCNFQAFRSFCEVQVPRLVAPVVGLTACAAFVALGVEPDRGSARVAVASFVQMTMALGVLSMLAVKRGGESTRVGNWAWLLHAAFAIFAAPRLAAGLGLFSAPGGFDILNPELFNTGNGLLAVAGPMIQALVLLGWMNSRLASELRQQADTDELTRLHSRRSFFRLVERRLRATDGTRRARALFMMDLDHFKQINDRYGHQVGDQMLVHFGQLLRRSLSSNDVAGRYGGEEFCAYVVRDDRAQVDKLAEQLCMRLRHTPPVIDGVPVPLTVSIGVAHADGAIPLDTLISTADRHVYLAKAAGRDCWIDDESASPPTTPSLFTPAEAQGDHPTMPAEVTPARPSIPIVTH